MILCVENAVQASRWKTPWTAICRKNMGKCSKNVCYNFSTIHFGKPSVNLKRHSNNFISFEHGKWMNILSKKIRCIVGPDCICVITFWNCLPNGKHFQPEEYMIQTVVSFARRNCHQISNQKFPTIALKCADHLLGGRCLLIFILYGFVVIQIYIANKYSFLFSSSLTSGRHKCPLCTKSYTTKQAMKEHMWNHTGVKPHKCQVCDKQFGRLDSLKKHAAVHSGKINES